MQAPCLAPVMQKFAWNTELARKRRHGPPRLKPLDRSQLKGCRKCSERHSGCHRSSFQDNLSQKLPCLTYGVQSKVVGWALAPHLDASLAVEALDRALADRKPKLASLIHHSDRGVQYASTDYRQRLAGHEITVSMRRPGNPYDNAKAESFMKALKTEEVDGRSFKDLKAARRSISVFINTIYNTERLHSALGYCPPLEFETNFALTLSPK